MAKNLEAFVKLSSKAGLHGRPGVLLVQLTRKNPDTKIFLEKSGKRVKADSVLALLSLGVKRGEEVRVLVNGEKAERVMNRIKTILRGEKI